MNISKWKVGAAAGVLVYGAVALSTTEAPAAFLGENLKPFLSVSEMYDSNVFRVRDREQLRALVGDTRLSDFLTIVSVGTAFRYQPGIQELNLLLKKDLIRFSHYSSQNSDRDEVSGNLALRFLDRVRVRIDGGYTSQPEPRTEFRSASVNEKTVVQYGVSAGYETASGIGFEAAWRRMEVGYSLPEYVGNEHDLDRYSGTISYTVSPQGKVYLSYEREERAYREGGPGVFSVLKRDNTADSVRAGFSKTFSPKTVVSGYAGYVNRRYSSFETRNFSGLTGRADVNYAVTNKIGIALNWERDLYEETYSDRVYSVNNSLGLGGAYQMTEKIKWNVTDRVTWKDFRDVPGSGAIPRNDFLHEVGAGVEWTPVRRLSVNLGYQLSTRSSTDRSFDFTSHAVTAGVAYRF
jgi:opacity protein-like surface antigen